jgi:uncharacterized protein (DUF3820 family)
MNKAKLTLYEHKSGVNFKIKNINQLDIQTIEKLKNFALKRGGYFRQDIAKFDIKRKLNQKQILQVFELLEIAVEIIDDNENSTKDYPTSQEIVNFGKYKGYKWCDIPLTYLKWLYKENENVFAYTEIKRRETTNTINIENEIIRFGKFRGEKWINLPIDYLQWAINKFPKDREEHKIAKIALSKKS